MKKVFAVALGIMLMFYCVASAEVTSYSQLESMTKEELVVLAADLLGLKKEAATVAVTSEETEYVSVQKGDKGNDVKKVQARLIELGYLSGNADGAFGNGTMTAVKLFQNQNGLAASGIADAEMQTVLFSSDCPKAKVYGSLEYKGVSRNPDEYTGKYVKFDGKVLQEMQDDDILSFRIATKGNYDNVVYVIMKMPENYSRILEDDKVTVYGAYADLYSYTTVMGATVTIPLILADMINLK